MLKIKNRVNSKSRRHLLPAFVLYLAAAAAFKIWLLEQVLLKSCTVWIFNFLLSAVISFLFYGSIIKTPAL